MSFISLVFSKFFALLVLLTAAVIEVDAVPIFPNAPSATTVHSSAVRVKFPPDDAVTVGYLWVPKEQALELRKTHIFTFELTKDEYLPRLYAKRPMHGQEQYWLCTVSIEEKIVTQAHANRQLITMPNTQVNPSKEARKKYVEANGDDLTTTILLYTASTGPHTGQAPSTFGAVDFPTGRLKQNARELYVSCVDPKTSVDLAAARVPPDDMEAFGVPPKSS
ncbi:hypothetical protein DFJ43DRAFT_1148732 [Lentinula guzmanii]|uniref:Uncharacterized protein n=1 Tax=Lentinula guzmanii TaxID=2804957 RepID=A0AA38JS42_9AGAR|nr:hypothetical protein DFJ43DRAFT_1148732 [Lentinula guzmanii]